MDEPDDSDRDENGVHLVRRRHVCEEPVRIGSGDKKLPKELQEMLDKAKKLSQDHQPGKPCWNAPPGATCMDGRHVLKGSMAEERCQRNAVEIQILALRGLLAECKFEALTGPVAEPLWRALEPGRPITVDADGMKLKGEALSRALRDQLAEVPRRHALRLGKRGTGKTHHALTEYFWCLERGIAAVWLSEQRWMEIVSLKESTDAAERVKGQSRWTALARAPVVFLDDLCMDDSPPRQKQPGRPLLQVPLVQLQGEMLGVLRVTTNRSLAELNAHPDCGGRALSRLSAPHKGVPPLVWEYEGEDQRLWETQRALAQRAAGVR